jgi:hypothetical protein
MNWLVFSNSPFEKAFAISVLVIVFKSMFLYSEFAMIAKVWQLSEGRDFYHKI